MRVFSTQLSKSERRVYGAATVAFFAIFLATMWPVYPLFSRIRPFVFGVPMSLVYLLVLVFAGFFSLLALYVWEDRRGKFD